MQSLRNPSTRNLVRKIRVSQPAVAEFNGAQRSRLRRPSRPRKYHPELALNGSRRARSWDELLALRMIDAAEGFTLKRIADLTLDHPENVRRHMNNGRVTARFLAQFCVALELEPRWLLLGEGPMRKRR